MDFTIRAAVPADAPAIAALEAASFALPREEGVIERAIGDFMVAEGAGRLLGYGDFHAVLDEGYIGNVAVAADVRRQGLGAALLDALLERGKAENMAFLTLEVRESNAAARSLYASRAFEIVGRQKKAYERPAEDAILMTYFYKEG